MTRYLGQRPPANGGQMLEEHLYHALIEAEEELRGWLKCEHDADCECGCRKLIKLAKQMRISAGVETK
jgi:hypothetical protein